MSKFLDTTQDTPARYYVIARNNLAGKPGAIMYASGQKRFSLRPSEADYVMAEQTALSWLDRLNKIDPRDLKKLHPSVVDVQLLIVSRRQVKEGFDLAELAKEVYEGAGV